jgi:glyoxylase-like metal-dependent hydrolase (beta-lactamase superfamily II)
MGDLGDLALPELFRTDDVTVYKPYANLFVLQSRKDVSSSIYLIVGTTKSLLLDTGKSVLDLTSVIKRLTDLPFELALTHGHHDHTSAIGEFDHLYMHAGDRYLIPDYKGTVIDIDAGYRFDLGDRAIEVVDLIAHTPGSIGFLDPVGHRLFTGDALGMNPCYMQLTPFPLERQLSVVSRVEALYPAWTEIWCGHFNHLNQVVGLDYLRRLKTLIEKVLEGGYPSEITDGGKVRHKLTFDPHIATFEGQGIIFNPANLRAASR